MFVFLKIWFFFFPITRFFFFCIISVNMNYIIISVLSFTGFLLLLVLILHIYSKINDLQNYSEHNKNVIKYHKDINKKYFNDMGKMKIKDNVFVQNNKNILDSILQDNQVMEENIENNELDIENNEENIENNELDIENNELDIENNEENIENNELDIENNELDIEKNELDIENNELDIENNELDIENNELDIEKNANLISNNFNNISGNSVNISGNSKNISENSKNIYDNKNNISGNSKNILENKMIDQRYIKHSEQKIAENKEAIRQNGSQSEKIDYELLSYYNNLIVGVEKNTLNQLKQLSNKIDEEFDTTTDDLNEFDSVLRKETEWVNMRYGRPGNQSRDIIFYSLIENDMMS